MWLAKIGNMINSYQLAINLFLSPLWSQSNTSENCDSEFLSSHDVPIIFGQIMDEK